MGETGERVDAVIVGAGPCGLAAAIALKKAGLTAVVLDRSCVASGVALYPPYMSFFSTAERIAIGGLPFVVAAEKPTRRDALAYYRMVVTHFGLDVRQYEDVVAIEQLAGAARRADAAPAAAAPADDPGRADASGGAAGGAGRAVREAVTGALGEGGASGLMTRAAAWARTISARRISAFDRGAPPAPAAPPAAAAPPARDDAARFVVRSVHRSGRRRAIEARAVVVATGYFGTPSLLGVPGEELPHVTHYFTEGHYAFQQDAVVVGGGNSAVDAALDLYRAGARVTMVHFGPGLDPNVKPWVMPDIAARIREGRIGARWQSRVASIDAEGVTIRTAAEGDPADGGAGVREERLPADHVFLATGFLPNTALLDLLGVPQDPETGVPAHDPATMETAVPGVFIAGVIASGFNANRIFIENGRDHGDQIAARLVSA